MIINLISLTKNGLNNHPFFQSMLSGSVDDFILSHKKHYRCQENKECNDQFERQIKQIEICHRMATTPALKQQLEAEHAKLTEIIKARRTLPTHHDPEAIKDFQRGSFILNDVEVASQSPQAIAEHIRQFTQSQEAFQFISELGGQNFCNFFLGFVQLNIKPILPKSQIDAKAQPHEYVQTMLVPTQHKGIWKKTSDHEYRFYIKIRCGYAVATSENASEIFHVFKPKDQDSLVTVSDENQKAILQQFKLLSIDQPKEQLPFDDVVLVHAEVVLNTQNNQIKFYFDKLDIYIRSQHVEYTQQLNLDKPTEPQQCQWVLFDQINANRSWFKTATIDEATLHNQHEQWPEQTPNLNLWWSSIDWWYGANSKQDTLVITPRKLA